MGGTLPRWTAWRGLDEPSQTLRARFRRSGRGRGRENENALLPAGQQTDWSTRLTAENRGSIATAIAGIQRPFWIATASGGALQCLQRSPVRREGGGHWDLLAVDLGPTLLCSEPLPLVRRSWLSDGILRNVGTRWDHWPPRNPRARTNTRIVASLTCWLRHNYKRGKLWISHPRLKVDQSLAE